MTARFTIAQLRDGHWVWKLVHYSHVYHRSRKYKTKAGCEAGMKNFWRIYGNAICKPVYECVAKQPDKH